LGLRGTIPYPKGVEVERYRGRGKGDPIYLLSPSRPERSRWNGKKGEGSFPPHYPGKGMTSEADPLRRWSAGRRNFPGDDSLKYLHDEREAENRSLCPVLKPRGKG